MPNFGHTPYDHVFTASGHQHRRSAEFSAYLFVGITNGLNFQLVNKPQDRFLNFEEPLDGRPPLGFSVFSEKLLPLVLLLKPFHID